MFRIYSFLLAIGFLVFLPVFFLRREKYLSGLKERLGDVPTTDSAKGEVIWLHCVSVGEVNAAEPLIDGLIRSHSGKQIVVSTTTRTGQERARKLFAGRVETVFYFPFDFVFCIRKALDRIKPSTVLLMETEIWFNFIREASLSGARVAIVNGRLSERSRSRYEYIQGFLLYLFPYIDLAVMQSDEDASRMIGLGMDESKVMVGGNLKFDRRSGSTDRTLADSLARRFGFGDGRQVILATSTHEPEEKILMESFERLRGSSPDARLVIAPRHPERFREVVGLANSSGHRFAVRSEPPTDVDRDAELIVIDSIGELESVYPHADVVFVGGSLIPHGGQNVLEPAAASRAIVTGPSTHNFSAAIDGLESRGAIVRLHSAMPDAYPSMLAEKFSELLKDDRRRAEMGDAALALVSENSGATARTIELLKPVLD